MKEESDIREALEAVHNAIDETAIDADRRRTELQELQQDIQNSLRESGTNHHQQLMDRLETAVAQLEAEHPTLAQLITQAINVLNNAGV